MAVLALTLGLALTAQATTLGIKSNNPGNIVKTSIHWKGEVACKSRFECFDTPEHGLRAMALNLLSAYYRHGHKDGASLLKRWSPPHENNLRTLRSAFKRNSGLSPYEQLDFADYATFRKVMVALIIQENGKNPYGKKLDAVLLNIKSRGMNVAWRQSINDRRHLARKIQKSIPNVVDHNYAPKLDSGTGAAVLVWNWNPTCGVHNYEVVFGMGSPGSTYQRRARGGAW